ncbi:MAG TPA: helix-turn-helix domain-containing protein [Chthoniobacterales bacterium]|jgi:excisionase family DNA binding protein|nr:helix-turn-helix domain-containing protein [Chthoniobacterales bacterium]
MHEELLKYPEVAKRLRLERKAVVALVKRRAIPAIRLSPRAIRFRWSEVEAALAKLTVKAI